MPTTLEGTTSLRDRSPGGRVMVDNCVGENQIVCGSDRVSMPRPAKTEHHAAGCQTQKRSHVRHQPARLCGAPPQASSNRKTDHSREVDEPAAPRQCFREIGKGVFDPGVSHTALSSHECFDCWSHSDVFPCRSSMYRTTVYRHSTALRYDSPRAHPTTSTAGLGGRDPRGGRISLRTSTLRAEDRFPGSGVWSHTPALPASPRSAVSPSL